jgi:4-amino-4-deoxy-L-arabinose transferase
MVETGKYLVPTLDYQPHWTKPPLAYWGIAAGIILFGHSEWGVRFFNTLSFFLTIIAVVMLGTLLWDRRVGLIAGLIYLASPFPFFGANVVSTDTLLTLLEVFSVLFYFQAYRAEGPERKTFWITVMWFFFGLGFLTKGPPSLLPLIPLIAWNYTRKNKTAFFKGYGLPLFFITGFSWFILVSIQNPHLVNYFLKTEVVDRVSSQEVHNPEWYGPFTIYLPVLLAGQGAWLYFGLRGLWRCIRSGPQKVIAFIRVNEEVLFTLLWIAIPLLVFSISRSRLELYVLPLYAPIALIVAHWISGYEGSEWKQLVRVAVVSIVVLAGLKFGIAGFPHKSNMKQVYAMSMEAGSRNAEYFVFEEDRLYGMQFYLNGMMQRVTLTGNESWADTSIDDLLTSLQGEKMVEEYLILASKKKAPLLKKAMSDYDLDIKTTESKHWTWFRVTQKPE